MPLFEVDRHTRQVTEIRPTSFPALKLWERRDLEAWVTSSPGLVGGDFEVVTSEYDHFDRTNERLDVLGIVRIDPGVGKLVVVELKRDGTSTTVDLQAIKYAAYVAAAQFTDVVDMYARYHALSESEARNILFALLGGSEDELPRIDDKPRIVLVASDFRPEVTTTVLWLADVSDVDIRCVRLQPFQVGDHVLVHSEVIIPLPEAEQYRLGVQRKRREEEHIQEEKARQRRLLPMMVEGGALKIGDTLYFRRDAVPADAAASWSLSEPLYRATLVSADGNRNLTWSDPVSGEEVVDSPSLAAARLLFYLGAREGELSSAGVNGNHYWTVDGERSLRDVAGEAGILELGASRTVNRQKLYDVCAAIPSGSWTTYGDVADAIGAPGAAQSVATMISTDERVENAHRVLRATARISPGWTATGGGGPEVARARLEAEGVTFDAADAADPLRRWNPAAGVTDASSASHVA